MAETKTETKKLKKQVLLNETDALPVADIDMTIDGRYITAEEFREMVETFDPNNLKVGWYIGHIENYWMEKDKEPEKQGIIRDIEFKDGVLYVYSQDLNPEFLRAIKSGKYTDLSIEAMRLPTTEQIENDDGEMVQQYKWYFSGIAAVKTGAFSRYGLVEYKQFSKDGVSFKILNKSNFFDFEKKSEEKMSKTTKTKEKDDQIDVIYTEKEDPVTTTIEDKTPKDNPVFNAYVDNRQKEEMRDKEEILYLKAQVKTLKNKLEDKNNEIDELKKVIPEKDDIILKKDFMIFYLRGIHEEKLHNKFMGFDEDVNILSIKLEEDIYKSQMWRDYSSSEDMRKSLEKQLDRKFFVETLTPTQYGNIPVEIEKEEKKMNYNENDLYEYAKNLAMKEKGVFESKEIRKYLNKAKREIAKNNF